MEQLEPVLRGRDQLDALARLQRAREDVLGALRHLASSGAGDAALRMCLALAWYWSLLDSAEEAASRIRVVLEAEGASTGPERAYAEAGLVMADIFTWEDTDVVRAWGTGRERLAALAERLAVAGELGNQRDAVLRAAEQRLADWRFVPNGSEGFAKAEVTVGGIATDGLSSRTMAAISRPRFNFSSLSGVFKMRVAPPAVNSTASMRLSSSLYSRSTALPAELEKERT